MVTNFLPNRLHLIYSYFFLNIKNSINGSIIVVDKLWSEEDRKKRSFSFYFYDIVLMSKLRWLFFVVCETQRMCVSGINFSFFFLIDRNWMKLNDDSSLLCMFRPSKVSQSVFEIAIVANDAVLPNCLSYNWSVPFGWRNYWNGKNILPLLLLLCFLRSCECRCLLLDRFISSSL